MNGDGWRCRDLRSSLHDIGVEVGCIHYTVGPASRFHGEAVYIPSGNSSRAQKRNRLQRRIWKAISRSPFDSLWDLQGVPLRVVAVRTWKALLADRVFDEAAELGFYFLFAVFPILFCASSVLGLVVKSAHPIYARLLNYLSGVVPAQALRTVQYTLKQTAAAATSGKVTIGSAATVWAASVGVSAIQSSLNAIYKIKESRSFIVSQVHAILLTFLLVIVVSAGFTSLFAGNYAATLASGFFHSPVLESAAAALARFLAWTLAGALLSLSFALIYYWVPGWEQRRWHWLTPGTAAGIAGWLIASVGLRFYLVYFNRYSVVYGSLGAVIILLTWFYISGLMLLLGAEINKEIELEAAEKRIEGKTENGHS